MKISDEIALSARNLARRKGRTALTLIGVVIGTCMVVLMISLGIAQTQANDEMLQSWGDLTQVQVYGYGTLVDANGKTIHLDDAAIVQNRLVTDLAVDPGAVERTLVDERCLTGGEGDLRVMAGDGHVVEEDVAVGVSAQRDGGTVKIEELVRLRTLDHAQRRVAHAPSLDRLARDGVKLLGGLPGSGNLELLGDARQLEAAAWALVRPEGDGRTADGAGNGFSHT